MLKKPTFKPHFYVEIAEPDRVYLLSEKEKFVLKGRLYSCLAPLLNGERTVDDIVALLRPTVSFLAIYRALTQLETRGYLVEGGWPMADETAAFWHLSHIDPAALGETAVSLITLGSVDPRPMEAALTALGVTIHDQATRKLVLTDSYLRPELADINQSSLDNNEDWLLAKPVGAVVWLGPLFVPQETGCWACLAQRLQGHGRLETAVAYQQQRDLPLPTTRAENFQIGTQLAAIEAAKWAVQGQHEQLHGQIRTFDLTNLGWESHALVKRPQCPSCGEPLVVETAVKLQSCPKRFTSDGGHRICSPEAMLATYSHHISSVSGIVDHVTEVTPLDSQGHVYAGIYATTVLDKRETVAEAIELNVVAGKGRSDVQAQASLLGEALERYSSHYFGNTPTICDSYRALGNRAIHPATYLLYSQRQLCQATAKRRPLAKYEWVGQPFDETREIEWTAVWSLTHQTIRYLPTTLCYFRYPVQPDHLFGRGDSNGNAAGNSMEEAILQGFMELIERDSVAIWWYNRLSRPGVDLASFSDAYLLTAQESLRATGRDLWVLDLTTDLRIPAFVAISPLAADDTLERDSDEIVMGFGAHFDPLIAISRAVSEAYQMLGHLEERREGGNMGDSTEWLKTATLAAHPYLQVDEKRPLRTANDYVYQMRDDLRDDVQACVDIVAAQGLETFVLNLTQPDVGLPVVKVFVPGLRHFWTRFAPGRLYDVPVKMGWLERPFMETELNPLPMFL
ncbi:MAG: TOMM precursor leader peptide-binding protein [Chloroflexota bacterium]